MGIVAVILVALAVIVGVAGGLRSGVDGIYLVAFACFLAILARMAQASGQTERLIEAMGKTAPAPAQGGSSQPESPEEVSRSILASEIPQYEAMGWRVVSRQGTVARIERP